MRQKARKLELFTLQQVARISMVKLSAVLQFNTVVINLRSADPWGSETPTQGVRDRRG
jgi:hypothetical protein